MGWNDLIDCVPVTLMVAAEAITRHRGLIVHPTLGASTWTISCDAGALLITLERRAQAEWAMRRISEVIDFSKWPADAHWASVLTDRVTLAQKATLKTIITEARTR